MNSNASKFMIMLFVFCVGFNLHAQHFSRSLNIAESLKASASVKLMRVEKGWELTEKGVYAYIAAPYEIKQSKKYYFCSDLGISMGQIILVGLSKDKQVRSNFCPANFRVISLASSSDLLFLASLGPKERPIVWLTYDEIQVLGCKNKPLKKVAVSIDGKLLGDQLNWLPQSYSSRVFAIYHSDLMACVQ